MTYKFVLRVKYGTGSANFPTNEPDLIKALKEFKLEYGKKIPDTKMYGMPEILSAELQPLMYRGDK